MKTKRKVGIVISILIFCIVFIIIAVGSIIFSPFYNREELARFDDITSTVRIYDRKGVLDILTYNNGKYISIEELPKHVYEAFICVEDQRFYEHNGVDYVRIIGATIDNIKARRFKEGASTITQQLIKNTLLSSDKSVKRKIKEIKLAGALEKKYTKAEILEKYLNVIYFGSNVYGIENASKYYFGRSAKDLTPSQSAMLAGIINNPTLYNPYKNSQNAISRRNFILKLMKKRKVITEKERIEYEKDAIALAPSVANSNQYYNEIAHFLRSKNISVTDENVSVTVPIDRELSEKVEKIVDNNANNYKVNVIIAENSSADVLCNVSTFKYDMHTARFMPGSVIKPVLCYAPLLENNEIYTVSSANDEPYSVGLYSPENYAKKYRGRITQREALAYSSNSVALQNAEKIGLENAVKFAGRTGLTFDEEDKSNYSTALGGLRRGFTLNEMLTSYMTIARNGNKMLPRYVSCIDKSNYTVFSSTNKQVSVMKPQTAFLLSDMMRDCVEYGTGKILKDHKNVCAKTGTVGDKNGNSECYCIAFSPRYTVLCHVSGGGEKLPSQIMGGTLPARIVNEVFYCLDDESEFCEIDGVVKRNISVSELRNGNVVQSSWYDEEINKKSCYFSVENLPECNNSYDDFIENYNLRDPYYFDVFDCFVY